MVGSKLTLIDNNGGINPNTVKKFYYIRKGKLFPKMGRPPSLTTDIKEAVFGCVESSTESCLNENAEIFGKKNERTFNQSMSIILLLNKLAVSHHN